MNSDVIGNPGREAAIDLEAQTITWKDQAYTFPNNPFTKKCLLEGLDDIGYTLSFADAISAYEQKQKTV